MSADDAMNPWFARDGVGAPRRAEIPAPGGGSAPPTGGADAPPPGRMEQLAGTGVFKVLTALSMGLAVLLITPRVGLCADPAKREYARRAGERFDTLPVVFLLVSLALTVAVGVVIGALQVLNVLTRMAP